MKIYSKTGSIYSVTPKLAFAKGDFLAIPDTITAESLVLQLQKTAVGRPFGTPAPFADHICRQRQNADAGFDRRPRSANAVGTNRTVFSRLEIIESADGNGSADGRISRL